MKAKSLLMLVAFPFLLILGCSTPYQHSGALSYGYSEKQLSDNVWRITFEGDAGTTANEAYDKATLRAADLAISHGYKYFIINDVQTTNRVSTLGGKNSISTSTFNYPTSTISVSMYKDKPDGTQAIYDARFVCQKIGAEYDTVCGRQ